MAASMVLQDHEHKHAACRCTENPCLELYIVFLVIDLVHKQLAWGSDREAGAVHAHTAAVVGGA